MNVWFPEGRDAGRLKLAGASVFPGGNKTSHRKVSQHPKVHSPPQAQINKGNHRQSLLFWDPRLHEEQYFPTSPVREGKCKEI